MEWWWEGLRNNYQHSEIFLLGKLPLGPYCGESGRLFCVYITENMSFTISGWTWHPGWKWLQIFSKSSVCTFSKVIVLFHKQWILHGLHFLVGFFSFSSIFHLFFHSFNKYLKSTYYLPGTLIGSDETEKKLRKDLALRDLEWGVGRWTGNTQTSPMY